MKVYLSKIIFVILLCSTLSFTQCGGGGSGGGSSGGGSEDLVTALNALGTWIASSGNIEDITSFTISEVDGFDDRVTILVNFSDGSTDTGVIFFTDEDETGSRSVSIELSSGTVTGSISLADDCQTMTVKGDGDTGVFTNTGNICTDN